MKLARPVRDYRQLRLSNLGSSEFEHLKLLIFWPIFGILFFSAERLYKPDSYIEMYCPLDDYIPFEEIFVIPYLFWFVYIIGMHLFTLLYDIEAFEDMMKLFIITNAIVIITYIVFPNVQYLRPTEFERDNFLTRFMADFYQFDTNTNVCPSLHVVDSLVIWFTSLNCSAFKTTGWRIAFGSSAFLICISTVFLKQHSVIDIFAAIPLCIAAYFIVYVLPGFARRRVNKVSEVSSDR